MEHTICQELDYVLELLKKSTKNSSTLFHPEIYIYADVDGEFNKKEIDIRVRYTWPMLCITHMTFLEDGMFGVETIVKSLSDTEPEITYQMWMDYIVEPIGDKITDLLLFIEDFRKKPLPVEIWTYIKRGTTK